MELKDKVKIIEQVFKEQNLHSLSYKAACLEVVNRIEKAINYSQCCVNKDLDKHPIEGVNEFMQTDTELEEIQLCEKSNCNRQKLEGNVYCSYHYDINFG